MTNTPKTTPKDFFLHIGIIATLYISVVSFITLWFRIIDAQFADPLSYVDPYSTGISLAIASLIVIFPAFLGLSWLVHNEEKRNPEKREIKLRKWLIFLTIFFAGGAILIDLITLLHTFLSGKEITQAFIWKIGVVLIVAAAIFSYFMYKIREQLSDKSAKSLILITGLVVLASLIIGFMVMGSPAEQRQHRLDQQRVNDLSQIQWRILEHWQSKERLPDQLSALTDSFSGFEVPVDPVTGAAYEYVVIDDLTFELCATFAQPSVSDRSAFERGIAPSSVVGRGLNQNWEHDAGRHCFERTIDPELYPVRKQ